jgi:serine/threonine protein kinase
LRTKKCLKEYEADGYIRDIFKGLMYLAENYIVHRDLKVANIFIHKGQAKIADFGFAKFTKSQFKDINIGSPIYMSPEGLINNIYGPKTDIWAFGMLIYELLHGETPFSHCKSEHELKYNMSIPIGWSQLKAELSNEVKEVMLKCLEVEETKRISAAELKKLAYFRRGQSMSPMKTAGREQLAINSYDYRVNGSFNNESLGINSINENRYNDGVYRNNFNEGVKNRIKTENALQPVKKTAREYSDMPIR